MLHWNDPLVVGSIVTYTSID